MAQDPALQRDEQYPLLNPDGAGDAKKHVPLKTVVVGTELLNVTCAPKQSWCSRWPQFISACWMSLVLLVISFFVFYALGMSIYRRQPIVILKCNESKPAGDVYYHYIVPMESALPFKTFSDYISFMATTYPSLRFQIYFLMDDTSQYPAIFSEKSTLLKKFVPHVFGTYNCMLKPNNLREIQEFQRKYLNVNISVLCLSKYMAKTPLRFEWKSIPLNYLPFYARIYEMWKNGGIGFDLITHNYRFNTLRGIDPNIHEILQQHNDGIKSEKYAQMIDNLDNQDDIEIFQSIFDVFNNFLWQTQNILNTNVSMDIKLLDDKPAIITHRGKRSVDIEMNKNDLMNNIVQSNHTASIVSDAQAVNKTTIKNDTIVNTMPSMDKNTNNINTTRNDLQNGPVTKGHKIRSYFPPSWPRFHVYDIAFIEDNYLNHEMPKSDPADMHSLMLNKYKNTNKNYLILNSDGGFLAVSSRCHPFLMKLLLAGYFKTNPQITIRDTFRKHCSNIIINDPYCDSIKILYNL